MRGGERAFLIRACLLSVVLMLAGGARAVMPDEQGVVRALFIGNSFIYENNLPAVASAIAAERGVTLEAHLLASPGATLDMALRDVSRIEQLRSGAFDVVVIQPRGTFGRGERWLDGVRTVARDVVSHSDAFQTLTQAAADSDTQIYLVSPWRGAGSDPTDTYAVELTMRHAADAAVQPATVVPVGRSFLQARDAFELFQPDGYHPSPLGTYLAAKLIVDAMLGNAGVGTTAFQATGSLPEFSRGEEGGWEMASAAPGVLVELSASTRGRLDQLSVVDSAALPAIAPISWPASPQPGPTTPEALTGYWRGEIRLFPQDWPFPAQMELNVCRASDGALVAEVTYAFIDAEGFVRRRDHFHAPIELDSGRIIIRRGSALWASEETLIGAVNEAGDLSGIGRLINVETDLRAEGAWRLEPRGASWTCF